MSVTTTPALDTSAMNTVHTLFRRELRLAAGLVRGVADGDHRRAKVVATHLDLVERTLHHHHTAEDGLLWPKLLDRVPREIAPLVGLMEAQHGTVDTLLGRIGPLRTTWQLTTEGGEELAALYEQLYVALDEHLVAEEQQVLPLVARCLTQAEWDELGEAGRKGASGREMALVLGMIMYDGDPAVVRDMLADAPAPVRALVPRLGRRAYRKHARKVHGTETP